ncbi:hypothetical protein X975_13171, partial [Stegodyphus mimosarum]
KINEKLNFKHTFLAVLCINFFYFSFNFLVIKHFKSETYFPHINT